MKTIQKDFIRTEVSLLRQSQGEGFKRVTTTERKKTKDWLQLRFGDDRPKIRFDYHRCGPIPKSKLMTSRFPESSTA